MELFECQLTTQGFTVCRAEKTLEDQMCDHAQDRERVYYYYVQQCDCCLEGSRSYKSKELIWYRYGPLCKKCFDCEIDCLGCGGHYTDGRVFRQENVSRKYWVSQPYKLDPEELIGMSDEEDSD